MRLWEIENRFDSRYAVSLLMIKRGCEMDHSKIWNISVFLAFVFFVLLGPCVTQGKATSVLTPLCTFGAVNCGGGPAGFWPYAAVARDGNGNLFGTTSIGGTYHGGVVFKISSAGVYSELYEFCSTNVGTATCTDGRTPLASVVIDTSGNLYGTTNDGGAPHSGTHSGVVFELSPPPGGTGAWTYKVLHRFCSAENCLPGFAGDDGAGPVAGLSYAGSQSGALYDGTSPLYGTTPNGGIPSSYLGTVFRLTPTGSTWTYSLIHEFCWCAPSGTPLDGFGPSSGVTVDASGNLYGTARGGSQAEGVVYELSPSGSLWTETILYNFGQKAGVAGQPYWADGQSPDSTNVVLDGSGNLFGTTSVGGTSMWLGVNGGGVVFELKNPINNGGLSCASTDHQFLYWCEVVLYSFCGSSGCPEGATPSRGNGLFVDPLNGAIYGTTEAYGMGVGVGGVEGGTIYKLTGANHLNYHQLYNFCATTACNMNPPDGDGPYGGLIRDSLGNFYGTTVAGGTVGPSSAGYGLVYEFTP